LRFRARIVLMATLAIEFERRATRAGSYYAVRALCIDNVDVR
jgi:hypothetical protein